MVKQVTISDYIATLEAIYTSGEELCNKILEVYHPSRMSPPSYSEIREILSLVSQYKIKGKISKAAKTLCQGKK